VGEREGGVVGPVGDGVVGTGSERQPFGLLLMKSLTDALLKIFALMLIGEDMTFLLTVSLFMAKLRPAWWARRTP
jgi:hypothetical protein